MDKVYKRGKLRYDQQAVASGMAYFEFNLRLKPVSFQELHNLPVSEAGEGKARRILRDCHGNIIEMREWRGAHDPIGNVMRWRISTSLLTLWGRLASEAEAAIETIRQARIKAADSQMRLFDMDEYLSESAKGSNYDDIPF